MTNESFKRKLTAILSADVEGYSRLMGEDEDATIRTLTSYRELMSILIQKHRGRVVDSPGDNLLAEFGSVVDSVRCAVEIQEELRVRNAELPENRRMQFRIGVNLGDVVEEGERIYGDGVNITARVEGLAEGGGICISGTVYDSIKNKLSLGYESLGEHAVKNIAEPVRVYRMRIGPEAAAPVAREEKAGARRWLKTAVTAGVVLVVAAGVIWYFYFRHPPITPADPKKMEYLLPEQPSIAVLPFANMSDDPKQEYFSDGITEEIITALSKTPKIFVIARNSTFTYKGKPVKVQQVAEELGVRYVLEGSVRKAEDKVRITAQLVDAITGKHMWAERYDRKLEDIFSVQDEITKKIITELKVKLTEGEQVRIYAKGTDNLEAYLRIMRVFFLITGKPENIAMARQLAEEAVALDPNWPLAYCFLGTTHTFDVWYGLSKDRAKPLEQAYELGQKALALDEKSADAHYLLSIVYTLKKQSEKAIEHGKLSVELEPNSAMHQASLARLLMNAGRYEESIPLYEKALRRDPYIRANSYYNYGYALWALGRYEEALAAGKEARSRRPNDMWSHFLLAVTYIELGRDEEARASAAEVLRLKPDFTIEWWAKMTPWVNKDDVNRMNEDLRKAGLPEKPPLTLPDKPAIAVLPFANMSNDPEQAYFCDGIADQIITSISKIPYITVIARNSSFAYKGKSVDVQQIAGNLGVRYVLEGSLQRSNENVRINTQLIDAKTGRHLWAESYDRKLDDIFLVQDEICKSIMVALQVKLTVGEMARMEADTVNIKSYIKYIEALEHYHRRTKEDALVARQLFQEAIALDPEYAMAYLQVGWTYLDDIWLGMTKTPSESITKAEEMVQKAISIHGRRAGENALLTGIHLLKKDWDKAIAYGEKAVEQGPNYSGVQTLLGFALRSNGQYDEAILRFKKALQLNPGKKITYLNNLAFAYLYSKQYEKAISAWNETAERNPDYLYAYVGLTMAYWFSGSEDQARQAARQVLRVNPKFSVGYMEKRSTVKDKALKEQLFDAMRKSGLPE